MGAEGLEASWLSMPVSRLPPPAVAPEEAEEQYGTDRLAMQQVDEFRVGDHVSALFYGEWHAGKVRTVQAEVSTIEILWDSEFSVSILPVSDVKLVTSNPSRAE